MGKNYFSYKKWSLIAIENETPELGEVFKIFIMSK